MEEGLRLVVSGSLLCFSTSISLTRTEKMRSTREQSGFCVVPGRTGSPDVYNKEIVRDRHRKGRVYRSTEPE